jgi:hypothetical protein
LWKVVENNEFHDRPGTALFIGGAGNVGVSNNRISAALAADLRRRGPAVLIERSDRGTLADNAVSDPRAEATAAVEIGPNVTRAEDGVRISPYDTARASANMQCGPARSTSQTK